jgi:hypothetical protein
MKNTQHAEYFFSQYLSEIFPRVPVIGAISIYLRFSPGGSVIGAISIYLIFSLAFLLSELSVFI